jgi:hypothetical protein
VSDTPIDIPARERIASELLGTSVTHGSFTCCPGHARHTKGDGSRDFRVLLDAIPTGHCFHSSCSAEVESFNHDLRSRIWHAEHGSQRSAPPPEWGRTAPEPRGYRAPKRPDFDPAKLTRLAANVTHPITADWLIARSPVPIPRGARGIAPDFLEHPLRARRKSPHLHQVRIAGPVRPPRRKKELAPLPRSQRQARPFRPPPRRSDGVWFLCNPVTGHWRLNPNKIDAAGRVTHSRRHGDCVTAWRYLVLESDVAAPAEWLKILVQLSLPIAAIYTSGGKSIHALLRIAAASKPAWDHERNTLVQLLAPLGADPAAMTAVRLTRLPGTLRGDRLQELYYLNPRPDSTPLIYTQPSVHTPRS